MSAIEQTFPPVVHAVEAGSAADRAGICVGDLIVAVNGQSPRDIIEWHLETSEPLVEVQVVRAGLQLEVVVEREGGEPFGVHVESAVFDRVRTCDNHCDFCFIYQLPKNLRSSLYLKDDDYRLSFLYGNFTTLTRFTESDLERVIGERISPLNVSIHSTDPQIRSMMLRNDRGGISLRWLREMLKHDIVVRGQIVLCPGVNDGAVLEKTLTDVLTQYSQLESLAIVPLGLSKFNPESHLRIHTRDESRELIAVVDRWREVFTTAIGRPMVFAADEFYISAGLPWPNHSYYGDFSMYEDGIGMVRQLQKEFDGTLIDRREHDLNFFRAADRDRRYGSEGSSNPAGDTGLRRKIEVRTEEFVFNNRKRVIVTSVYGRAAINFVEPNIPDDVVVLTVENNFFGGNTSVTGLLVGQDINAALIEVDEDCEIFIPDVCLSSGRFLDGLTVNDLIRDVKVVATDGRTLRRIIEG